MAETKDRDIVHWARQMERHRRAMYEFFCRIEESDHPNAESIARALIDNGLPPLAFATHVVSHDLEHPDRWEAFIEGSSDSDLGIRHRAATKAAQNQR